MKKPTRDELLNMPIGTKITTDSKSERFKRYIRTTKYAFRSEQDEIIYTGEINIDLTLSTGERYGTKIIKVEKPHYETVWKEKEILDEVEKEYLSAVIKPFKKNVRYIELIRHEGGDFICINLKSECTNLPYFKSGTMYKGMEIRKAYTLEELGL